MTGKITAYVDCVSPYSYMALLYLERNREPLRSHNVSIDIVPVFLGGINVGSGNKPPWTLPAKAAYSKFDSARAKQYHGVPKLTTPSFFPILSLLPQRALVYIKSTYVNLFVTAFLQICSAMWQQGPDMSKPEHLAQALSLSFSDQQVKDILAAANSPEVKQALNDNTNEALERGAFGCPWFWVRNAAGAEQPFFGSDRFHFMWEYLGLPWKDVELLHASVKAKI